METADLITIIADAVAVTLAIVAIWLAVSSRREAARSAQTTATNLAKIEAEAERITATVEGQLNRLIDQISEIANSAVPKPPSQEDVMQTGMLQMLFEKPDVFMNLMQAAAGAGLAPGAGSADEEPASPSPGDAGVS